MATIALFAMLMLDAARTPSPVTGAAMLDHRLITWGDQIIEWSVPKLKPRTLARRPVARGEGGCIFGSGLVVQEGLPLGNLVLRRGSRFKPEILDVNVQMHDCMEATLFGRRGVLVVHRYAQIRFYEAPERKGSRWPYKEIYSIYTPALEGGLLMADIDGDGVEDIVCGNYWMRAPAGYDLPWREFAINTWSETPESATMRIMRRGTDLIVAQGHKDDARLSVFSPPGDITQLWNDHRIGERLHLRKPHALALAGTDLIVGENDGQGSRLFVFRRLSYPEQIGSTAGVHSAFVLGDCLLTVGSEEIRWWFITR